MIFHDFSLDYHLNFIYKIKLSKIILKDRTRLHKFLWNFHFNANYPMVYIARHCANIFVKNFNVRFNIIHPKEYVSLMCVFSFLCLGLELVVAIFPGTTTAYNMIKTCGDITFGVLTQGVEDKNVNRLSEQTVSNIILKINTKLGGRNWFLMRQNVLFSKYLQELYNAPVMFFGADVTHPNKGTFIHTTTFK